MNNKSKEFLLTTLKEVIDRQNELFERITVLEAKELITRDELVELLSLSKEVQK